MTSEIIPRVLRDAIVILRGATDETIREHWVKLTPNERTSIDRWALRVQHPVTRKAMPQFNRFLLLVTENEHARDNAADGGVSAFRR